MRLASVMLVLLSLAHAQRFRFSPLSEVTILEREGHAPDTQDAKRVRIEQLFLQAGCNRSQLSEEPLQSAAAVNVICRLPGKSGEKVIIVGASYGQNVPESWTSAALLPSLFQALSSRKRHHTFIFVAFADGSKDLAGAQFFAGHMTPADVDNTEAMVNLDALGFSPTKISSAASDKKLVESFFKVVYSLRQMASQVDLAKATHVDSEPFALLSIPQITIHSLTQDAVADLHSPNLPDPVEFRADFYYHSYRLLGGYLAYLDETLKPRHHEK